MPEVAEKSRRFKKFYNAALVAVVIPAGLLAGCAPAPAPPPPPPPMAAPAPPPPPSTTTTTTTYGGERG